MKILVINSGSSSIKYKLFDMADQKVLASGLAERIGEKYGFLRHISNTDDEERRIYEDEGRISDHREGLSRIVDLLTDKHHGTISDISDIVAIGHRVVHGGERFKYPTIINEGVIKAIREMTPLAPLHNPPNLLGIETARSIFPSATQVAVFDTAFHQTIPEMAFLYAIPYRLYEREGIRRYGFHGTSHSYVSGRFAEHCGRPLTALNLITIHLGNGASMAAVKKGRCFDTTMGMTPLEGLVMGTRCGDIDPAIPFFLSDHLGMSMNEIDNLLNKESGLKGLCGTNDMREVLERASSGDTLAKTAVDVYCYRIKKYIGAFYAGMGSLDGIVFTGGIGENAPAIRELSCSGLTALGIEIDPVKNTEKKEGAREIQSPLSSVKIMVIPTDEEFMIARETEKVINTIG